ncbi:MAG TPA: diacylglycerol kinase family protein [Polyangiaceae bacterium]|nr:diacylglycerol kinase family protein [Polyangiaceae bacterium]
MTIAEPRSISFRSSTKAEEPAFIVNRKAGGFRRDPDLERRIRDVVRARGKVYATTNEEELDRAVREAVALGASPLVFCGGDGTYLAGVTALVRAAGGAPLPVVGLARAGTVSIVAKNWNAERDVVRSVRAIAETPERLRVTTRPTLLVESDGVTRVGFTFGTGLVANFFEVYDQASPGGLGAAFRIALRTFFDSFRGGPYAAKILGALPCRITVDGAVLPPSAWSLVVCSVLRDVGLHMLVTYRAGEDAERPHLVASPLPPRLLGPQWPLVTLGKPIRGAGNFDGLVNAFSIEFPDRGPFVLDGDTFHAKNVRVSAGPEIVVVT